MGRQLLLSTTYKIFLGMGENQHPRKIYNGDVRVRMDFFQG